MFGTAHPIGIIAILVIAVLVFGGRGKISAIMGDLGKGITSFRKGLAVSDRVTLGHRVEALGYDLVTGLLRLLPFSWVSAAGGWLLRLIGPLTSKHRVAETNLRTAFPDRKSTRLNSSHWW